MHMPIIHRDKKWKAPANHYVMSQCPTCAAVVDGKGMAAQHAHQNAHLEVLGWMDAIEARLAETEKRCGITEEAIDVPPRYEVEAIYPGDEEDEAS